jgi:hypothetical protein
MIPKAGSVSETRMGKERKNAEQAIAVMIRQSSEAGRLISESEILRRVADQHLLPSPAAELPEEVGNILKNSVEESEDLHALAAPDRSRIYYSSTFMTEAYATILLHKQGDPLRLIAETIRDNSALYPRPVPLDIFTHPPFELTLQEVLNDLKRMETEEEYRDILTATTSTSRVFLYSTLYLEPDHASMLAEWLDVGQFDNP